MNWQEILTLFIPLITLGGWAYLRMDKKFEMVLSELKELRKDVQSLDSRLSRVEGQLTGVYHWEPRWTPPSDERKLK